MTPFERSFSKLSENHEIVEIGSPEFKLWQLKESLITQGQWYIKVIPSISAALLLVYCPPQPSTLSRSSLAALAKHTSGPRSPYSKTHNFEVCSITVFSRELLKHC